MTGSTFFIGLLFVAINLPTVLSFAVAACGSFVKQSETCPNPIINAFAIDGTGSGRFHIFHPTTFTVIDLTLPGGTLTFEQPQGSVRLSQVTDFTKKCDCAGGGGTTCGVSVAEPTAATCAGPAYEVKTASGPSVCVKFGSGIGQELPAAAQSRPNNNMLDVAASNGINTVTITLAGSAAAIAPTVWSNVFVSTSADGKQLVGMGLFKAAAAQGDTTAGVFFSGCGPFVATDTSTSGTKKRVVSLSESTLGTGSFVAAVSSVGDPHLRGANGVKYDLAGVAGGVYSLFISPVFQVNMQLAEVGPEIRFMTKMGILYRGTELVVNPWSKAHAAEITEHFSKLNATVEFNGWQMVITFCDNHIISIAPRHTTDGTAINFLDFAVSVPGCHDSYGGALGHTYQCAYVLHKKSFEWSTEREESFRLATLTTPSGTYSKGAECAHEDEFGGDQFQLLGGMSV